MAVVESYNMGVTPIRTWLVGENIRPSMLQFATGFFYQHTVQQMKREAYLITNRHVAIDEERSLYPNVFKILIHNSIDMLRSVREVEISLYDENMNPLWYEHPHIKDADIVAFGGGIGDAQRYYDFFKRREGNAVALYKESVRQKDRSPAGAEAEPVTGGE